MPSPRRRSLVLSSLSPSVPPRSSLDAGPLNWQVLRKFEPPVCGNVNACTRTKLVSVVEPCVLMKLSSATELDGESSLCTLRFRFGPQPRMGEPGVKSVGRCCPRQGNPARSEGSTHGWQCCALPPCSPSASVQHARPRNHAWRGDASGNSGGFRFPNASRTFGLSSCR